EHEDAVAALRVDLVVAARGNGDVLLAVDHVRHARRIDAGTAVVLPQFLAGAGVVRLVPAVRFTVEHEITRGGKDAANQRLWRLDAPLDLAGVEIRGHERPALLLTGNRLEGSAQPQFAAARIRRLLD